MPNFFEEGRLHDGLHYEDYREAWSQQLDTPLADDAGPEERRQRHYLKYNWDRQAQVHASYAPSEGLRAAVEAIEEPQLWTVLTEPWCGDSAFLLPVIAEAAGLSDQVSLRILPRDENLDIMDEYLTDGSRSIPKLVVFSTDGGELFTWGPRPDAAARRFETLAEQYDDKMELIGEFLEHYEGGGWKDTDAELAERLQAVAAG
ncbi:thioredoxin family protein [Salinibacter altiplanensis]|uniref:thioredoxin family protein n=1 Tax=Salinibacter altiplanensis TaxID=1803181 RepID=UPI000C9F1823|nr:thioredoxin family protein [Salinibacter altiplanensis]